MHKNQGNLFGNMNSEVETMVVKIWRCFMNINISKVIKAAILVLVIVYVLSPLDACPGPIDDVIVALIGLSLGKGVDRIIG